MAHRFAGFQILKLLSSSDGENYTSDERSALRASLRDQVQKGLQGEIENLKLLSDEYDRLENLKRRSPAEDAARISKLQADTYEKHMGEWRRFVEQLSVEYADMYATIRDLNITNNALQDEIGAISLGAEEDGRHHKRRLKSVEDRANKMAHEAAQAHRASTAALIETREIRQRLLSSGPKFSKAANEFIEHKTKQLLGDNINSKEPAYFRHRIKAFIDLVGDKPIGEYNIADLSSFAERLSYLPERHGIDPLFSGMSVRQAIEFNDRRRRQYKCIARKTIDANYVGKIKTALRWLCSVHRVQYPFEYAQNYMPRDVRPSLVREGLPFNRLNKIFAYATCAEVPPPREDKRKWRPNLRAEDVWLPLLGFLTGARLGELVYLRYDDFDYRDGVWIAHVSGPMEEGGKIINRPAKSENSVRRIALHRSLEPVGFHEWLKHQRQVFGGNNGYIFPRLHAGIKRPSHAASKRFQHRFEYWGVQRGRVEVFHSLRHNFKDWLREQGVSERTIALQAGHSLDGIAINYGAKRLRPDELELIANLDLPKLADLSPYHDVMGRLKLNRLALRDRGIVTSKLKGQSPV